MTTTTINRAPRILSRYGNGNYRVTLYDDGTKVRETDADAFAPSFPESIDLKITDYCDAGCGYCHEGSTVRGGHGDLSAAFLGSIRPGTELAIGGGNPLAHPDLSPFLRRMRSRGVVCNLTVNQFHLERTRSALDAVLAADLIYGVGVSFLRRSEAMASFLRGYRHAVAHIIAGIVSVEDMRWLASEGVRAVVLGYKTIRRGAGFFGPAVASKQAALRDALPDLLPRFEGIAFDNLALEQLDVRRLLNDAQWAEAYMGEDGTFTLYIDLVARQFARSSTSMERWPLESTVDAMLARVRAAF